MTSSRPIHQPFRRRTNFDKIPARLVHATPRRTAQAAELNQHVGLLARFPPAAFQRIPSLHAREEKAQDQCGGEAPIERGKNCISFPTSGRNGNISEGTRSNHVAEDVGELRSANFVTYVDGAAFGLQASSMCGALVGHMGNGLCESRTPKAHFCNRRHTLD